MLFPKNFDFFELFEAHAKEMHAAAEVLKDLKDDGDVKKHSRRIKDIEHNADKIAHGIWKTLNKTFITPIEREDISDLTHNLDDVVDDIERVMSRLNIYKIEPLPIQIFQFMDLIVKAIDHISQGVKYLKDPKKKNEVSKEAEIINFIENEADDLLKTSLSTLFQEEKDPIKIIKLKEIYETLEAVTDRCEDVANIMETIVLKNY